MNFSGVKVRPDGIFSWLNPYRTSGFRDRLANSVMVGEQCKSNMLVRRPNRAISNGHYGVILV